MGKSVNLDRVKAHGYEPVLVTGSFAVNGTPVAATATITCLAVADLVDGETVTLTDAAGTSLVFEFDDDASVTGDNVAVDISAATTAAEVATALASAINGEAILITATADGADVDLVQDTAGSAGNTAITDTVADADFLTPDFTGGDDKDVSSAANKGKGFTVARIGVTNVYRVTWNSTFPQVIAGNASLQLATPADQFAVVKALSTTVMDIAVWDISGTATANVTANDGNRVNFWAVFKNANI